MRRRLAVTAVAVTALFGEWIGHGISYYRVAGVAGLEASLGGGVHDYMLPLAAALLAAAAFGAAGLVRAWLTLGRRLDSSARLLARLRRGDLSAAPSPPDRHGRDAPPPASMPSPLAGVLALALPLATLQCAVYLVQENLERALRGIPAGGFGPLLDGGGAAMWIQAAVALALATVLTAALLLIRRRSGAVQRLERLAQAFWQRSRSTSPSTRPRRHVTATQLLLGSALWQRPPPAPSPA
jgi:HAMP domain-containing protein